MYIRNCLSLLLIGEFSYFSTIFANTQVKSPFLGQRSRHGLDFSRVENYQTVSNLRDFVEILGCWAARDPVEKQKNPPCNQQFEPENGMLEDVNSKFLLGPGQNSVARTAVSFRE